MAESWGSLDDDDWGPDVPEAGRPLLTKKHAADIVRYWPGLDPRDVNGVARSLRWVRFDNAPTRKEMIASIARVESALARLKAGIAQDRRLPFSVLMRAEVDCGPVAPIIAALEITVSRARGCVPGPRMKNANYADILQLKQLLKDAGFVTRNDWVRLTSLVLESAGVKQEADKLVDACIGTLTK